MAKRTAKNSVFHDLFQNKSYLLKLYKTLHPEDTIATEDSFTDVTLAWKTNQISGMSGNLHTTMLNELERLEIRLEVTESSSIGEALRQADFRKRIKEFEIPECLVMVDRVRFLQVADNIISNSYKYEDTEIEVRFGIFALINRINTLMTNFVSRQQEFGVMCSAGLYIPIASCSYFLCCSFSDCVRICCIGYSLL